MLASSWVAVIAAVYLTGCGTQRPAPSKAYDPCGDMQKNLLELQHIEDELNEPGPDNTLDKLEQLKERKRYLNRTNERLQKDCGR